MATFGWCLDGHHKACWKTNGQQVCDCKRCGDDHGIEAERAGGVQVSDRFAEVLEKYRTK